MVGTWVALRKRVVVIWAFWASLSDGPGTRVVMVGDISCRGTVYNSSCRTIMNLILL
jgi:hypothetical protein